MSRRRPGRAFTITELLVSVAIVALLLGILVPSLGGVRASARGARCVTNLRQMASAAQGYALQHHYYPPAIRYKDDGVYMNYAWDWVTTFDGKVVSPGPLWSFTDDPGRVQQCPSYHGVTDTGDPHTGYNYNTTYVGGESRYLFGWDNFRCGIRLSSARRTAGVALFGDGGRAGGTNKYMRAPMNEVEGQSLGLIYTGAQAFRHQHATNVAWLDLHVAPVSTPHPGAHATQALLDQMGYPSNGFLSDDDRAYDPR